jgi:hypothetical protein
MARNAIYTTALVAAFAMFAVSGGIQASERAVNAVDGKPATLGATFGKEAGIPFANRGNIRDWRPDGTQGLFIQDAHGHWYHAGLIGICTDLPTANQIAFLTRGPDRLDKFSAIAVRGQHCQFSSLVTSDAPAARPRGTPAKG